MGSSSYETVQITTTRKDHFNPPTEWGEWRAEAPIRRLTFPDGHRGWLVSGYRHARTLLADPRFSNRPELQHAVLPILLFEDPQGLGLPPGFFIFLDPPEHTRYRGALTGQFTVRRMRLLESRVAEIVTEHLDAMEAAGPPADLMADFALPIPSLVICELLGVPYDDREVFQRETDVLIAFDVGMDEAQAAMARLAGYLLGLVARKRAAPSDDLLGGLAGGTDLSDAEITGMAFLLLGAGHETTASMLGLGTLALLRHPAQLAAMRDDPDVVDGGVEELMRYLSVVTAGVTRAALDDVEFEGHLVKAGESVVFLLPEANRDPLRFGAPDELDLSRTASGHLAFGHGIHQCLGQQLARIELRIAFPALLRRFPGLRPAVPIEQITVKPGSLIHGLTRFPVTW
ncbi:cytochrome P450 [Rhizohabitans arisaemae]|uniref:cytochrome P450 n=1 Tax=Rhizohabitans arisaemae TaxID=2720610 RepID=UPI0024B248D9|nr:cytochrome P450 [Rhizohabitans arisaemae]